MLVASLAHQVANALVHRYPRGRDQAWHARDNSVVPGGDHIGSASENRDELKHIVFIGSENRSARQEFRERAAGLGIEALHGNENRKDTMALSKSCGSFPKARNVLVILSLDLSS